MIMSGAELPIAVVSFFFQAFAGCVQGTCSAVSTNVPGIKLSQAMNSSRTRVASRKMHSICL